MQYNVDSLKADPQREDFQQFWDGESPTWAGKLNVPRRLVCTILENEARVKDEGGKNLTVASVIHSQQV